MPNLTANAVPQAKRVIVARLALCLYLILINSALAQQQWKPTEAITAKVLHVGDGDTLDMDFIPPNAKKYLRVRLRGVDAPEKEQKCIRNGVEIQCGRLAGQELSRLILGKVITCAPEGGQSYGRMVAICYVQEGGEWTDVNAAMVRMGWAVPYVQYSTKYVDAATTARKEKLGLWATSFERPACYRKPKSQGCPCQFPQCIPE